MIQMDGGLPIHVGGAVLGAVSVSGLNRPVTYKTGKRLRPRGPVRWIEIVVEFCPPRLLDYDFVGAVSP